MEHKVYCVFHVACYTLQMLERFRKVKRKKGFSVDVKLRLCTF